MTSKKLPSLLVEVRQIVADYMHAEGCDCCRNREAHERAAAHLAKLLDVPSYLDGSGFDFAQFRSEEK